MEQLTINPWLHIFSFWYLTTTVYTLRNFFYSSLTLGTLGTWAFVSDSWMHASVYIYWEPNGRDIPLPENLFLVPFAITIMCLYFKFVILTHASNLIKVLLAVIFVVGTVMFTPPNDSVKDLSWHYNHAVLHLITAAFSGVCAMYFKELRMLKQKPL